jgi:hypothetical protein
MIEIGLPRKVSKRDLVRDLSDALAPYGIKLLLYVWLGFEPGNLYDEDRRVLGWADNGRNEKHTDFVCRFLREIGERYENEIAGFWFDGGLTQVETDTVREVNKDAVIFHSYGRPANGSRFNAVREDFWTSEHYGPLPSTPSDNWPTHLSQINKIIGGEWWASYKPVTKTTARELFRYTVRVASTDGQRNGGVLWAASPYMDNNWEDSIEQLIAEYGKLVRKHGEVIFNTLPSSVYPTPTRSVLPKEHWGAATESLDGEKAYVHVLNAPNSNILRLPEPVTNNNAMSIGHGKIYFTRAEIMGREAGLEKTDDGWAVTLPSGMSWDADDTVVTLWTCQRNG